MMSFPALIIITIITKIERNSRFCDLSIDHKPNMSLQLIVSACDNIPINFQLSLHKNICGDTPSFIHDNKHFLQLLESLSSLPENAIMVTPDGATLYINKPHEGSIKSVLQYMKLLAKTVSPGTQYRHTIDILLETILRNIFIHGLAFSSTGWHNHGNQIYPPICKPFHETPWKKYPGMPHLSNPFQEKIHRQHIPGLSRHY